MKKNNIQRTIDLGEGRPSHNLIKKKDFNTYSLGWTDGAVSSQSFGVVMRIIMKEGEIVQSSL